jgi:hypothetical protein
VAGFHIRRLTEPPAVAQPLAALPCQRTIVALDIGRSTSRPDLVKAELRKMMYAMNRCCTEWSKLRR